MVKWLLAIFSRWKWVYVGTVEALTVYKKDGSETGRSVGYWVLSERVTGKRRAVYVGDKMYSKSPYAIEQ